MNCADCKTHLYFPIWSAWIADHAEHATFPGIGSRSCPRSQVSCEELGENLQKMYEVYDYARYKEKALEHEPGEAAAITQYFQQVAREIGRNVFTGLHRVNPANLHTPDLFTTFTSACSNI